MTPWYYLVSYLDQDNNKLKQFTDNTFLNVQTQQGQKRQSDTLTTLYSRRIFFFWGGGGAAPLKGVL